MEQVALGSSLNDVYIGILTMQNGSSELLVALLLYVLNSRIFGTPILVNFGTVIVARVLTHCDSQLTTLI